MKMVVSRGFVQGGKVRISQQNLAQALECGALEGTLLKTPDDQVRPNFDLSFKLLRTRATFSFLEVLLIMRAQSGSQNLIDADT
jgi:hypothetical protein